MIALYGVARNLHVTFGMFCPRNHNQLKCIVIRTIDAMTGSKSVVAAEFVITSVMREMMKHMTAIMNQLGSALNSSSFSPIHADSPDV